MYHELMATDHHPPTLCAASSVISFSDHLCPLASSKVAPTPSAPTAPTPPTHPAPSSPTATSAPTDPTVPTPPAADKH